jgi:hypothetical protein
MRTIISFAVAGTALLLGIGTAGTMAQTPSGSPSQSAPVGKIATQRRMCRIGPLRP